MSLSLYMDVHVRRSVTVGLRLRGVDVLTAQEDDCDRLADPELMDRATELGRVLFSQDYDLLREAVRRQRADVPYSGLIFAPQIGVTVGQCIHDLELIAKIYVPDDCRNYIEYVPLA